MARPSDQRRFPRAKERLPVQLSLRGGEREFSATVYTTDISLTGVFFASEFFMKPGLELDLEFKMPNDERVVRARGVIVREVRYAKGHGQNEQTGFAMQFTEYYDDAKTTLASSFLMVELGDFIEDYLRRRTKKPKNEDESLHDVIVAWEVSKMNLAGTEADMLQRTMRLEHDGKIRRTDGKLVKVQKPKKR